MSTLFVRILFLLALVPVGAAAAPRPDHAPGDTVAVAATARERAACLQRLSALCDDTALRTPESELRALIGKSWRPLENYGDRDSKLRVYNPKLGVAFRYSF